VIENLSGGVYELVVKDSVACNVDSFEVVITEPEELNLVLDSVRVEYCQSGNGSIVLEGTGGTGELMYSWSGDIGEQGAVALDVSAGEYDVVVIDENGCVQGIEGILVENIEKNLSIDMLFIDSTRCFNTDDGKLIYELIGDYKQPILTTLDGSPFPYENGFIANVPAGLYTLEIITAIIDNLPSGYYRCAIVDEKNCINVTDSIYLENPDSLIVDLNILNATNGENNGAIYVNATGGVMPYEYFWNYDIPTSADTIEFLAASDWILNFVDANGCMFDTTFSIQNVIPVNNTLILDVIAFPNPTEEGIYIQSHEPGEASIIVRNQLGQKVLELPRSFISDELFIPLNFEPGLYHIFVSINEKKRVIPIVKI